MLCHLKTKYRDYLRRLMKKATRLKVQAIFMVSIMVVVVFVVAAAFIAGL